MMASRQCNFGLFLRKSVALGYVIHQRGEEGNHAVGAVLKRARLGTSRRGWRRLALLGQPLRRSLHGKVRPEICARLVVGPIITQEAVVPASYARIIVPNPQGEFTTFLRANCRDDGGHLRYRCVNREFVAFHGCPFNRCQIPVDVCLGMAEVKRFKPAVIRHRFPYRLAQSKDDLPASKIGAARQGDEYHVSGKGDGYSCKALIVQAIVGKEIAKPINDADGIIHCQELAA